MKTYSSILMVRPAQFGYNPETAATNAFQKQTLQDSARDMQEKALKEFDAFVKILETHQVDVIVAEDTLHPRTPDSVFPNNWVSFHDNGKVILYPMLSKTRRLERRTDIIDLLKEKKGFDFSEIIDLSFYEKENKFLEGTGSIVFDYKHKIAYACISPRTDKDILAELCKEIGFEPVTFTAVDEQDKPVYHTNVVMCLADQFVIICLDSVKNERERNNLLLSFERTGHECIAISYGQMNHFAGNMYQLTAKTGNKLLVMSEQAHASLDASQKKAIEKYCKIVYAPLPTIEMYGGGSARCMMADVRLKRKE